MATAPLVQDQAALDLAATLDPTEIPTKLRCAVCNKLAVNAFKLPCCDQAICQYCQAALPESCPVCSHSPLEADMCKPHKALRMTIKVHLKTEEKKRAAADVATPNVSEPVATPAPAAAISSDQAQPGYTAAQATEPEIAKPEGAHGFSATPDPKEQVDELSPSLPQDLVTEDQPQPEHTEQVNQTPGIDEHAVVQTTEGEEQHVEEGEEQQQQQQQDSAHEQTTNTGFGFDSSNQNFQNMDWNANGFNPMMSMPNMQTGWGGFNNMMGI